MTTTEKRRPEGIGTALTASTAAPSVQPTTVTNADTPTRCRVCSHPVTSRRSVARQLGPVCRRRIAASIVLPGWRVDTVVASDHGGALAIVLMPLAVTP